MSQFTCFQEIAFDVPRIPGWCTVRKAQHLASLVIASNSMVTVEIGVYAGRSAIPMAMAHREIETGKVIAIDPWDPAPSIIGQADADVKFWSNPTTHANALKDFRKRIESLRLEDWIVIERGTSDIVPIRSNIGVLHIDGNHSEQASADVRRWAPHVVGAGYVVMDDLDWSNGCPLAACTVLESIGFRKLMHRNVEDGLGKDNYAVFVRSQA